MISNHRYYLWLTLTEDYGIIMIETTRVFAMLFCFYLSSVTVYAQSKIDSLLQVRQQAQHDTTRIQTDILIAESLRRSNFDSSLFYLNRALDVSKQNRNEKPHFEGVVLRTIGKTYWVNGKEEGVPFYRQALAVFAKLDEKKERAYTQADLGKYFEAMSEFDSSVYHYERVIERNLADGTDYSMVLSYNNAGLDYFYQRKLDKASKLLLDGIRYVKSKEDTMSLRAFYMNYGLVLKQQEQFELAKRYIKKSRVIHEVMGNVRSVALTYTNVGQILIKQDSLDEAYDSFTKAWELTKDMNLSTWPTAEYHRHLSRIEMLRGNYQQSHDYIVKSAENLPDYGVAPQTRGDIYGSLIEQKMILADSVFANNPAKQKQLWKEALPYAVEGWKLADHSGAGNVRHRLAQAQANLYGRLKIFDKAYQFSQLAKEISEEINNKARTEAIAKMTTEYQTELVEAQNESLKQSQKAQMAQLKQQNLVIYGAIALLVLILVIAVIIYRSRLKLKSANQTIEKSLSEKELLLKEIHHRVKNNLQVVSSLLDLQSRGIEDEEALSTFMEGQNRVKAMALIHQKLYQNEDLATIDFAEYAENLMKELATIYPSAKLVQTKVNSKSASQFDIDTAVPLGLILNELISNAYKYAFDGKSAGELNVSVEPLGDGQHQLTVSDSGEGLPAEFDFQKAKSLGLRLVRRLAKQLYGSVTYSHEEGAKFVVIFTDTLQRRAV